MAGALNDRPVSPLDTRNVADSGQRNPCGRSDPTSALAPERIVVETTFRFLHEKFVPVVRNVSCVIAARPRAARERFEGFVLSPSSDERPTR